MGSANVQEVGNNKDNARGRSRRPSSHDASLEGKRERHEAGRIGQNMRRRPSSHDSYHKRAKDNVGQAAFPAVDPTLDSKARASPPVAPPQRSRLGRRPSSHDSFHLRRAHGIKDVAAKDALDFRNGEPARCTYVCCWHPMRVPSSLQHDTWPQH